MGQLEMRTGDMREVMRLLTAVERTPDQERVLSVIRRRCTERDDRLGDQGIEFEVPVAQALDELLDGGVTASEGPGYTYALHEMITAHFSDPVDLGSWRRQSWLWDVDKELTALGVPAGLSLFELLTAGPPIRLPHPGDIEPWMSTFPVDRAADFVTAHAAVLDRLDPEVRETAGVFVEAMRFEAEERERSRDRHPHLDTVYFWYA